MLHYLPTLPTYSIQLQNNSQIHPRALHISKQAAQQERKRKRKLPRWLVPSWYSAAGHTNYRNSTKSIGNRLDLIDFGIRTPESTVKYYCISKVTDVGFSWISLFISMLKAYWWKHTALVFAGLNYMGLMSTCRHSSVYTV